MTVEQALSKIKNNYNVNILTESSRVCSYLKDFLPGEVRLVRRVKVAYESGAINLLVNQKDDKQIVFKQACQKVIDYSEVQSSIAEETISYFFNALGWKYEVDTIEHLATSRETQQQQTISREDLFGEFSQFLDTYIGKQKLNIKTSDPETAPTCVLLNIADKKFDVIKIIREYTHWNLTEAKSSVENLPFIFTVDMIKQGTIENLSQSLIKVGATVDSVGFNIDRVSNNFLSTSQSKTKIESSFNLIDIGSRRLVVISVIRRFTGKHDSEIEKEIISNLPFLFTEKDIVQGRIEDFRVCLNHAGAVFG